MPMQKHLFGLRPLFLIDEEPAVDTKVAFEWWANHGVGAGDGLRMMSAQAANEALRHCRIRSIAKKQAKANG